MLNGYRTKKPAATTSKMLNAETSLKGPKGMVAMPPNVIAKNPKTQSQPVHTCQTLKMLTNLNAKNAPAKANNESGLNSSVPG